MKELCRSSPKLKEVGNIHKVTITQDATRKLKIDKVRLSEVFCFGKKNKIETCCQSQTAQKPIKIVKTRIIKPIKMVKLESSKPNGKIQNSQTKILKVVSRFL